MNMHHGIIPRISNYSVVWGEVDYEYRKSIGINEGTIFTIGSPIYDNFINSIEPYHESDYVLLATSGPTKENIFDLSIETIQLYEINIYIYFFKLYFLQTKSILCLSLVNIKFFHEI